MVEVRKSTRIKAEPGLKRRFSDALEAETTPAKPAKAAKTTAKSTPKPPPKPSPVDEPEPLILPNKLTDNTPLPILPNPQPDDLPDAEWQNLSDSGVFAASLSRARTAIAKGAFLEKFWTKPVATKKQKDMTEEEKAALKAAKGPTQSKVGTVKMISEPLTFEVTLFMIKDLDQRHRLGQLPADRQHLIYGGPGRTQTPAYATAAYKPLIQQQSVQHATPVVGVRPQAPITPTPSVQHQQAYAPPPAARPPPQSAPSHQHPPHANRAPPTTHPQPPTHASPGTHAPPQAQAQATQKSTPTPAPGPTPAAANTTPSSQPKPATSTQAPDPVIHALAQRASANPELKAVMKIVATGRASHNQLQYFQKHIDELTELVRQRQEQEAKTKAVQAAAAGAARPPPAVTPAATPRPTPAVTPADPPSLKQETKPATALSSAPTQSPRPPPPATPAPATSQPQSTSTPKPGAHQPTHRPPPPLSTPAQSTASSVPPLQQHRPIPSPAPPAQPLAPVHAPSQVHRPYQAPQPPPSSAHHHQQSTPASQQQYYHAHPAPLQQLHTPAPAPRPRMVTTATPQHILIAFAENANERFLFPKNCVMEWNSTLTEVICSFVVVKKVPSSSGAVKKDGEADKEMWVPVTLTFRGDAPTLSVLGRVAEPLDLARERMEDVMCRGERGEEGFLALRLPVEARAVDGV